MPEYYMKSGVMEEVLLASNEIAEKLEKLSQLVWQLEPVISDDKISILSVQEALYTLLDEGKISVNSARFILGREPLDRPEYYELNKVDGVIAF